MNPKDYKEAKTKQELQFLKAGSFTDSSLVNLVRDMERMFSQWNEKNGPVSWQDSHAVISKHGAITCFQGPPLFRDALAQSSVRILQASIVPCNSLKRNPALAHKGNTLIYTEHNGNLPLRLPQEALTSFQDKSLGRQRQERRHWNDSVRKQNYSYRGWQTGKAIRRLVFGQFKNLFHNLKMFGFAFTDPDLCRTWCPFQRITRCHLWKWMCASVTRAPRALVLKHLWQGLRCHVKCEGS